MLAPQFFNHGQLRDCHCNFCLSFGIVDLGFTIQNSVLSQFLRFTSLGFIKIFCTDCRISQNGDGMR